MTKLALNELRENFEDLVRDTLRSYEGNYQAETILEAFDEFVEAMTEIFRND